MADKNLEGYNPNELKSLRPDLRKRHFYCCKCRKEPRLWASYGLHVAGRQDGQVLSGEGAIHGYLECHGDREEIAIGFKEANALIQSGEKIPVFDNVKRHEVRRIITPDQGGTLLT